MSGRLGKAERLVHQAFDPGAQCQGLPLDVLRVTFARLGLSSIEVTRGSAPVVRIIPRNAKRLQQGFAFQTHFIFAAPKDVREDVTTAVIHRVPQPPRRFCALHP